MKKALSFLCVVTILFSLAACGSQSTAPGAAPSQPSASEPSPGQMENTPPPAGSEFDDLNEGKTTHILVVYFSATGNTKTLAEYTADITGGDLFEIVPEVPYTPEDLNYSSDDSRSSKEQNDAVARPAIAEGVENMEQYDIVFLGYPIWWGAAPRIIETFLETYDFSGKTIVPFCTSGSSGIGSSAENLHDLVADDATWLDGERLASDSTREDLAAWIDGLGLNVTLETK